ncbi:MAG: DUF6891 domain-containing protein [Ancrocorticia sp.]|uniref:DUF6891 domain-containing protein n=2 Tax=Ancrocorticia sp. TaxID=2593684 RepID=UPI003F8FC9CC
MPLSAYVLLMQQPAATSPEGLWGGNAAKLPTTVTPNITAQLTSTDLAMDAAISPQPEQIIPMFTGHAAALELRASDDAPPHHQQRDLCEAIVALPPFPDAAVWFPDRHQITTFAAFVTDLLENPVHTFYWVRPSWVDEKEEAAVATVRGLHTLGAANLQVLGAPDSLLDFTAQIDTFVANAIRTKIFPTEADTVQIGETTYSCSPATGALTGEPLLQLSPIAASQIKPHWLSPQSQQIAEFEGPYAQLAEAFEDLQSQGITARMDFACCQNCGHTEIPDERTPAAESAAYPYVEQGYTFFHAQDSDGLAEGATHLYLAYGAFPGGRYLSQWPDSEPTTDAEKRAFTTMVRESEAQVGQLVTQTLRGHGLNVEWDGDTNSQISVVADWSAAPFPWARDFDDDEAGNFSDPLPLPPYDPTVSAGAWYVLLNAEPDNLGEPLQDLMPNYSARLAEEGSITGEIPYEDPTLTVSLSLIKKIDDPLLARDGTNSDRPDMAEYQVISHLAAVCITSRGPAPVYEQLFHQAAVASEIGKRPEALGMWIPGQERFEVEPGLALDEDFMKQTGRMVSVAVYGAVAETDDGPANVVYTRGMARLGMPEIFTHDPDDVPSEQMRGLLATTADKFAEQAAAGKRGGKVPQAGDTVKTVYRKLGGVMHAAPDPITGEPALNMELIRRKGFLGLF